MKLTKKISFVFCAFVALNATFARADFYGGLSPDDQAKIDHDEQVVQSQEVDGSAWPKVTVYVRAKSTTEQAAAVMFDYPLHKTMFGPVYKDGQCVKSGITESTPLTPGASNSNIQYTMVLQKVLGLGLPDEHYVVNDIMTGYDANSYKLAWTMVSASSLKDTQGTVHFEPLATGHTLIVYSNLISPPKAQLAKLIKNIYIQMVRDTVTSLVGQISSELSGNRAQMDAQVAMLRAALKK